jgi:hypothetical protein
LIITSSRHFTYHREKEKFERRELCFEQRMARKRSNAKARSQKPGQRKNPTMSEPETEVAAVEQVGEAAAETTISETTEPVQAASSTEPEEEMAPLEESGDNLESEERKLDAEIPRAPVENEILEKDESTEKELHVEVAKEEIAIEQAPEITIEDDNKAIEESPTAEETPAAGEVAGEVDEESRESTTEEETMTKETETTEIIPNEETTEDNSTASEESPTVKETPAAGEVAGEVDEKSRESVMEEETMTKETARENNDKSTGVTTPTKTKRNSLLEPVKTVDEEGNSVGRPAAKEEAEKDADPWVTSDSNIRDPKRRICIVTTAALPWRTGTAVNPLLRALYLTRGRPKHYVTLVIPWCEDEKDRQKTLGKEHSFANQEEHEAWIRDFCRNRAGCAGELHFL